MSVENSKLQLYKKWIQGYALITAIFLTIFFLTNKKNVNLTEKKEKHHKSRSISHSKDLHKPNGSFKIEIQKINEDDTSIKLKANVTPHSYFPEINLKWHLPEGVQILSGDQEHRIHHVTTNNSHNVEILVSKNHRTKNLPLRFEVYAFRNNIKIMNIETFFSEPKEIKRSKIQPNTAGEPNTPLKVFQ